MFRAFDTDKVTLPLTLPLTLTLPLPLPLPLPLATPSPTPSPNPNQERLVALNRLFELGLVTPAEKLAKKMQILRDL